MPVIRQPDKARDNKDRRISQDVERSRRIAAEVTYLIIFKYRHTVVPVPRYHLRYNISPLFTFPFLLCISPVSWSWSRKCRYYFVEPEP